MENAIQSAGSPVAPLRNSQIGPYAFPVVPPEFTNWTDEQRSWQESCALFDQSHYMTNFYIEVPDVLKLLPDLGVNSIKSYRSNKGKQFIACNPSGQIIGDAILFFLDENKLDIVGRPPAHKWVQYNIEMGGYNVTTERDDRSFVNKAGRRNAFRKAAFGTGKNLCGTRT